MTELSDVQKRAANWRAKREGKPLPYPDAVQAKPEPPDFSEFSDDLIKEEDVRDDMPEHVQAINEAVNSIDIFRVYDRLVRKERQNPGNKTESVMCSCPAPDHPDKHPSAWFGLVSGTWICYCIKCERAWNATQIASMYYGLEEDADFWDVKVRMAEEFRGVTVQKVPGGTVVTENPVVETETTTKNSTIGKKVQPVEVREPEESDDEEDGITIYPKVDWKRIVPEDTYLWKYLVQTTLDDAPEEYHFWHGALSIGHALGRRTVLFDRKNVLGNLNICLLGGTGYGKSRSRTHLHKVLEGALPFKDNGLDTQGVRILGSMQSGEALLDAFSHEATDPSLPRSGVFTSINGLVEYDELSMLVSLALRQASILKPVMMAFFDGESHRQRGRKAGVGFAFEPFCSTVSSTQPRAVRGILSDQDAASGYLNRWVFVGGPPKPPEIFAMPGDEIDLSDATEALGDIRRWSLTAGKGALQLTPAARSMATDFFRTTIMPIRDKDETDLLKRLDLIFKKLLLLFSANSHDVEVTESTVENVTQLFDYVLECYGILNLNLGITPMQDLITKLDKVINKHHKRLERGLTPREIGQFANVKNDENLGRALKIMCDIGKLQIETRPGTDKRTKSHRYIPID